MKSCSNRLLYPLSLSALLWPCLLLAHHSSSLIDVENAIWISGTVTRYEAINPHARITLDVQDADGEVREWTIEGPRLGRIALMGIADDFLQPGDAISLCAFHPRPAVMQRMADNGSGKSPRLFVHGRLLVRQDGESWLWGPYGKLEYCADPDDWDSINHGRQPLPDRP